MRPDRPYAAHEALVAPARNTSAIWRLLLGILVILGVVFFLSTSLQTVVVTAFPKLWDEVISSTDTFGATPPAMYLILGSFACVSFAVVIAVRLVHGRSLTTVLGPWQVLTRQFWAVARILLGIGVVIVLLTPSTLSEPLTPNLQIGLWLSILPFSLLAVLVQTSAEEILFRGYLQQQLAAPFASPWVWMGVPSAVFALGHYLPGEAGDNALLIALWAGLFGVMMADITARAGTLGPAIAIHFVNNVSALMVISMPDSLSGLSLYTVPYAMSDTTAMRALLPVDFAGMLVAWLAARVAIRR